MLKSRLRITSCFLWVMLTFLGFYPSPSAKADIFTTTGPDDYYFTLDAGTTFTVRTYAQQYGIDSQLWLYNNEGTVVGVNDDYFGLDSYISYAVQNTGTYRLRTSVCCGNPDSWYGTSYVVDTSSAPTNAPPTTTTSTTSTSTTTTTLAPYLNAPTNVRVTSVNSTKIYISWDEPESSNTEIEQYIVLVDCDDGSQPHLGAISQTTSAIIEDLPSNTTCQIRVRADNDTVRVYSAYSTQITGVTATTTTTSSTTTSTTSTTTTTLAPTTTTSSTTTTTILITTTTTEPPTTTELPTSTTSTTSTTVPETTTTIAPVTGTTSTSTTSTTLAPVSTTTSTSTSTTTTVPNTTTTTEPVQELVQVDPEVTALLGAISILPQSEIAAAVDNIIEQGVSAEEATALATNPEVLQSVTSEQATEIFDAVEVSDLSDAQAEQLIEAVQDAPEEVRAAFEEQINVFGGKFNTYVPVGSSINVGQRRVLIAASGVLFMAPAVSVSSSTSSSSSSDSRRK
jgi:hypothetical protein